MRVGVIANVLRPGIDDALSRLDAWIKRDGHEVRYEDTLSPHCSPEAAYSDPAQVVENADLVIGLGGDGTMLRAARLVGPLGTPILGVNLGSLGFLTQITPPEIDTVLARVSTGDFVSEERSVLALHRGGQKEAVFAFNDVTIDRGEQSRAIEMKLEADSKMVCRYVADGLIIATPTGSTAYALSAGGPILVPGVQAIVVTPVAPHTLTQRPIVFSDDVVLRATSEEPNVRAAVTLDGQRLFTMGYGESCEVRRADFNLNLVRFPDQDFYGLVRTKLHWGVDPRHSHRDGPQG